MNRICASFLATALVLQATAQQAAIPVAPSETSHPFVLEDGTPVKLRLGRTMSSADAHVGDTVDFEVLEEIRVNNTLVAPVGSLALATVTEAEPKKRMGRGGKLNVNIDSIRLTNGQKAALRAVQAGKGGGHVGAMTGAIVATSLVVWPAAPFFLFMHGKDIVIPKGTNITAYVNGNIPLDQAAFMPKMETKAAAASALVTKVNVASTPAGADVEIDGGFVGSTPSSFNLPEGDHTIIVSKSGYSSWTRKLKTTSGEVSVNAELEATGITIKR